MTSTTGDAEPDDMHQRRAGSFGAAAAAYARHRPYWADAAVDWVLAPVRDRRPVRVIDVGAGTGRLTGALARHGAAVTAVEPDPAMLAELRRALPDATAVTGRAEDIPLPDGSADAVVAGEAAHWFDMDRALPEFLRVLGPGGVLAGLWNTYDDSVGWVRGLDQASDGLGSATVTRWRSQVGTAALARLGETGLFSAVEIAEFRHGHRRTADSMVATIATHSALLVMDGPERERRLAKVRAYLGSRPETGAGGFIVPLVTAVVRAIRG